MLILAFITLLIASIWIAIVVSKLKGSTWGIVCFFLPLLALLPLAQTWSDRKSPLKLPCLIWFGCSFVIYWFASSGVEIDEFIGAGNVEDETEYFYSGQGYTDSSDQRARLEYVLSRALVKTGDTALRPAPIILNVPTSFNLYDQTTSRRIIDALGGLVEENMVGFLVHKSVELGNDESWVVEAYWYEDGYQESLVLPDYTPSQWNSRTRQYSENSFIDMSMTPVVNEPLQLVSWIEKYAAVDTSWRLDCHALKFGKSGFMQFVIFNMPVKHEELCLRSVRLAAEQTRFEQGERWEDAGFFSRKSQYHLVDFITGKE